MNIFAAAVIGYLVLTLFVGLWFSRKQPNTLEEYALAGRGLSTLALTISFIATFIGGTDLEGLGAPYKTGLEDLISYPLPHVLALLMLVRWVYPRLQGRGYMTLGDVIEPLYGWKARVLIGVLSVCHCLGFILSELALIRHLSPIAGLPAGWLVAIVGFALVLYTTTGGVRSVTVTDFLQFIFILAGLVVLIKLAVYEVGSFKLIFQNVWEQERTHIALWERKEAWLWLRVKKAAFWGWPVLFFSPPFFQRVAMASSRRQLQDMAKFFVGSFVVFAVLLLCLSFSAFSLPAVQADYAEHKHLFLALVKVLVTEPLWQILVLFFTLSLTISVADSFLNAGSIVLVRDVLRPVAGRFIKNELSWIKAVAALLGGTAVLLTAWRGDISSNSYAAAVQVLLSAVVVPLLAGLFRLKTTPQMFWCSFAAFMLVSLGVGIVDWDHILTLTSGIEKVRYVWWGGLGASILTFFVVHFVEFGGWTTQAKKQGVRELLWEAGAWSWETLGNLTSLAEAARQRVRRYGKEDIYFPLFMSLFYMLLSVTGTRAGQQFMVAEMALLLIAITLCAFLLGRPFWAAPAIRFYPLFYFITLGYCLPFVFTFHFFCDPGDLMAVISIGISMLLLSLLVDASLFFLLAILGNGGAILVWRFYQGSWLPAFTFDQGYSFACILLASLTIGFFFGRRRQRRHDLLHEGLLQAAARERGLNTDYLHALDHSKAFAENLEEQCLDSLERDGHLLLSRKLEQQELENIAQKMILSATHLRKLDRHLRGHLVLSLASYSLEEVARAVLGAAPLPAERLQLKLDSLSLQETVQWDLPKIKEVALTALLALDEVLPEEDILLIRFDRTTLSYREEGKRLKEVPAVRLLLSGPQGRALPTKGYEMELEKEDNQEGVADIVASRVQRIIAAHRGVLEQGSGYYALVLPRHVDTVRPKKLDKPGASDEQMEKAIHTVLPEEANLRAALRSASLLTPGIEEAITLMKRYHAHQPRMLEGPFAIHPLETARIVLAHLQAHPQPSGKSDKNVSAEQAIMAALLHDVVEDTKADFTLVGSIWGPEVQQMVARVSKLTEGLVSLKLANDEASGKFTDTSDPIGYHAAVIKVADRLHNLRTIEGHKDLDKRKQIALETVAVHELLAHELGARDILLEMHAICERVLGKKLPLPGQSTARPGQQRARPARRRRRPSPS